MANSEAVPTESGAGETPKAPLPVRRGILPILWRSGLFLALFAAALGGSWLFRDHLGDAPEIIDTPAPPQKKAPKRIETAGSTVEVFARGDKALLQHHYSEALSYYEELLEADSGAAPLVDYRYALCNESLGQLEKAITAYRKAITATAMPSLSVAAHLGMARCLLRQKDAGEARRLLYPFLFDETRQQKVSVVFLTDARYLAAIALAQEMTTPGSLRLSDDSLTSFSPVALDIPNYFDEIGAPPAAHTPPAATSKGPPVAVRQGTGKEPALLVRVDQTLQPAWDVLERLTKVAPLRLECSADAKKTLSDRSIQVSLRNWLLQDFLEQMADFFGLICQIEGDVVRVSTRAELPAERLLRIHRGMTLGALRGALKLDPSHPWAAAAFLELGNGEAALGHAAEAVSWFERVVREGQGSPYLAPAYYNLAQLQLRKHDFSRARHGFFRVVDQSPGDELALRALLRIGQLYLEEEDFKEAAVHLRRTQALAPNSPYHAVATLALAAAYLQQQQPQKAQAILATQRIALHKDPHKATAAFLDAYARYVLAKSTNKNRREASELLATLWRDQDDSMLGNIGQYLIAQAYGDLGFLDQAERLLRQACAKTNGPLATPLDYVLGETLLKQSHRDEAVLLFEKVAQVPSAYQARAHFQLAQLHLQDKQFKKCADRCKQLWEAQSYRDSTALLHLWGAALEGTGEFAKAAQCFAGKAPE